MAKTTPQSHGLFESCIVFFLRIRDRRNRGTQEESRRHTI